MWIYHRSQGTGIYSVHRRRDVAQCYVEQTSVHKIQWYFLYCTESGSGSEEGIRQCRENLEYYRENARVITDTLSDLGIQFYGGVHSPYVWFECPKDMDSWTFFDYLLHEIQVVGTPGAGFGGNGKRYFRLTSFGTYENTVEAMTRFQDLLETK